MKTVNILFTSAGRRVSLLRHFRQTLDNLGLQGKICAADAKRNAPAAFAADESELVPLVHDASYVPTLKAICIKHGIDLLIPLIDTELLLLAGYRDEFETIGVTPLVSSLETNKISLDKRKTYDFFKANRIDTPELFDLDAALVLPEDRFPLLLKPFNGSNSVGVTKIRNRRELEFFADYIPHAIIQEFLCGQEFTLDVLVDFKGQVRCVVPRLRMEIRAGEVSKAMTVKDPQMIEAAKSVVSALPGPVGCITLQCFRLETGKLRFTEINPRFGGGFPLSIRAGADYPRWLIEMYIGREPEIMLDGWRDGLIMLRYDDEIFLDGPKG